MLIRGSVREFETCPDLLYLRPTLRVFDAFLSYARADDKAFVAGLYARLTAAGFRIWFDEQEMPSRGETFLREIQHAIDESERLIAVVGPAALASDYVRAEWDYAQLFSKAVVPILRSGSSPDDIPSELRGEGYALVPEELRHYHCPDFRAERNQDEAFRELERILKQPVTAPGEAYHVPPLPVHFLPRRELLREIAETLLVDAFHPVTIKEAAKQTTLLHGLPGAGKSVLASAFARDVSIRRSFRDGVIWLTVTQTPDLLRQWRRIGKALKDAGTHYADLDAAEDRLQEVLKDRECLIVMDDVWEKRHVEPVYNALGGRCRLLLTAREKGIGRSFGAAHCEAAVLSPHEALSLLSQRSEIPVEHLPRDAEGVARACGYLPLALAMSGAMVKAGIRWKTLLDALAKADLSFLGHELANYPHPHVMRALQVSVDFMKASNPDAPARYHDLAVFLDARQVPESVVLRLWCHQGLDPARAEKQLTDFDSASLLRLTEDRRVELHDLQWDYVRSHTPDAVAVHRRLIAAYGEASAWPSMPDDGYFHARIVGHLLKAGLRPQVLSLVSRPWMQAQFRRTLNHEAFAADLELIVAHVAGERPPDVAALVRACLVRATLGALSTRIPSVALTALAMCGDSEKARGFAELIVEPEKRLDAFTGIAEAARARGDRAAERSHLTSALLAALRVEDRNAPDAAVTGVLRTWATSFGWRDLDNVPALISGKGDRRRVDDLMPEVRKLDPAVEAPAPVNVWLAAARRLQAGELENAFALIEGEEYERAFPPICKELCDAMATLDTPLPAIALCARIRNERLRTSVLDEAAEALAKAGRSNEARAAAHAVVDPRWRDAVLFRIVLALEERGLHAVAVDTASELSQALKAGGLASLARSRARAGALDEARALGREAVRHLPAMDDVDEAGIVSAYLAYVFFRTGDRDDAEVHLASGCACAERLSEWEKPGVVRVLASALIEGGEFVAAVQLVQTVASHGRIDVLRELVPPLVRYGQFHLAIDLLRLLEYDYQREEMLGPLTVALVEAHAYREAVSALETVGEFYRRKAAEPLALALVDAGHRDLAQQVARLAGSAGLETDIVVHMCRKAVLSGQVRDPLLIATLPTPPRIRGEVLKGVALAWREMGALDTAVQAALMAPTNERSGILAELALAAIPCGNSAWARKLLPLISRRWDLARVMTALVEECLTGGHLDEAFEIARAMPEDETFDTARTKALFRVFSRVLERERLDAAADVASSFESTRDRARGFAELARIHASNGSIDRARALLDEVLQVSLVVPADAERDRAVSKLGVLLAEAGHTAPALALADSLADVPRAGVISAAAVAEVAGKFDYAVELANSLEGLTEYGVRWIEADLFLALAAACLRQGNRDAANAFAAKGREKALKAYSLQDAPLRAMTDVIVAPLAAVYRIFRQLDIVDPVDAIFTGHVELLKNKRDGILRALSHEEATSGSVAAARELADGIEDARTRVDALVAIAGCLASRQDLTAAAGAAREALVAAGEAQPVWRRTEAISRAAAALVRAGDPASWTSAVVAALENADAPVAARAVSIMALALAESGLEAAARTWLQRLPAERPGDVQGEVAWTLTVLGDPSGERAADALLQSAGSLPLEHAIKRTALVYAARVFTRGDYARAFQCLVEGGLDDEGVLEVLQQVVDTWGRTDGGSHDPERQAAYWSNLCRLRGDALKQCQTLAVVCAALARAERLDAGILLLVQALADARLEGRDAIFAVLERGAPLLATLPDGRGLAEAVREIVEVEGWWQGTAG